MSSVALKNVARLRDITTFGAIGDGVTDSTSAIQAAIDAMAAAGGGIVYVPPASSYYRLTNRLILKDYVQLVGAGYGSWIKNDRTVKVLQGDQSVIGWGNYSGSVVGRRVDDETPYNCNNITGGERTVTTTTASHAGNFAEGNIVFIRNNTSDPTETDKGIYTHMEMNEVDSADAGTGVITLKYPHYQSASTVRIAKSSGTLLDAQGNGIQVRKYTRTANLRLENYYDADQGIFVNGGTFGSVLEDLWIDGSNAFALNAHYRCTIRNVKGVVSQKVMDHAYWSGFNTYSDWHINQGDTPSTADGKISCGEQSHDSIFQRIYINNGNTNKHTLRLRLCKRITVRDCDFIGLGATGSESVIVMGDTGAGSYGIDGCVLDNCRIYAGSPTNAIAFDNGAGNTPDAYTMIRNCTVFGTPTNALSIAASSKRLIVRDNAWPTLKITNSSTDGTVILRNNDTKTQNYEIRQGLNDAQTTKGADTTYKTYTIAQNGCSATGGWMVRAWGQATTSGSAGTRRVRIRHGGANVASLTLETSMTAKNWSIEAIITNSAINAQSQRARRLINDGTGPDSTQQMLNGTGTVDHSSGAQTIVLDYQLDATDTSVTFRGWEVIPFGHDKA